MFAYACFSFILVTCTIWRKQMQAIFKLWQYQCTLWQCRFCPQNLQNKKHLPTSFQICWRI